MLPLDRVSWRTRALLSLGVAILAGGVILGFWHPRRPFELSRANLSGAWLPYEDLLEANLFNANLSGANLVGANLIGAHLIGADLYGADLTFAHLIGARLYGADLFNAHLIDADLTGADLIDAKNLDQGQLDEACGTNAKLPPGLVLNRPCSP